MVTAYAVGDVDTLNRNAQTWEKRKMRLVRLEPLMLPFLVDLGAQSTTHKFYVANDIKSGGILELDFLEHLGATVGIKEGYLYIGATNTAFSERC